MSNKTVVLILKFAVTAVLIVLLLGRLEWAEAISAARSMNPRWLGVAVGIYFGATLMESARIRTAFGHLGLKAWGAYKLQAVGLFWALFFPGQIGGDVYRLTILRSAGGTLTQIVATLLALRVIAFSVIGTGAAIGIALVWPERALWGDLFEDMRLPQWLVAAAASAAVLAGVLFVLHLASRRDGKRRFEGFAAKARWALELFSVQQALLLFVISVAIHCCRIGMMYSLAASLGTVLALDALLFVTSLAAVANQLPIGFAGLGTREAAIVVLLLPLGVSYEEGTIVALAGRAVVVLFALWGGLLFSISGRKNLN